MAIHSLADAVKCRYSHISIDTAKCDCRTECSRVFPLDSIERLIPTLTIIAQITEHDDEIKVSVFFTLHTAVFLSVAQLGFEMKLGIFCCRTSCLPASPPAPVIHPL